MRIFGNDNTNLMLDVYIIGLTQSAAGLVCFDIYSRSLDLNLVIHLFVRTSYRDIGYKEDWYDGPLNSFGLGPFAKFCWTFDRRHS